MSLANLSFDDAAAGRIRHLKQKRLNKIKVRSIFSLFFLEWFIVIHVVVCTCRVSYTDSLTYLCMKAKMERETLFCINNLKTSFILSILGNDKQINVYLAQK